MSDRTKKPSPQQQRLIAALAKTHVQSVGRYFAGSRGQTTTRERIEEALAKLGLDDLKRETD